MKVHSSFEKGERMNNEVFRIIPRYENYGVTQYGLVKSFERDLILNMYLLNDYLIVDTFRGSLTETLPIHRAVALAWVVNSDPINFTIVNHKDGDTSNNWFENLEWTNHSGNNYHAVNNGLRPDNIPCKIRDFYTGQVIHFSSMSQASEYMGLSKATSITGLRPKKFGSLVADRYEFRFSDDPTPWFYETRTELVPPSRFMVTVKDSAGATKEIYSNRALLREYQLYDSPSKSILQLAEFGNKTHPDKEFSVRDSYSETQYRVERNTNGSSPIPICASKFEENLSFPSLTQCANYFNVDRSSILGRLNNGIKLDGWTFTQLPL